MEANTILDLYYGNIDPQTTVKKSTPELEAFRCQLLKQEEDLLSTLSEEAKHSFLSYSSIWSQYLALSNEATFVTGFLLGIQIMCDTIASDNPISSAHTG